MFSWVGSQQPAIGVQRGFSQGPSTKAASTRRIRVFPADAPGNHHRSAGFPTCLGPGRERRVPLNQAGAPFSGMTGGIAKLHPLPARRARSKPLGHARGFRPSSPGFNLLKFRRGHPVFVPPSRLHSPHDKYRKAKTDVDIRKWKLYGTGRYTCLGLYGKQDALCGDFIGGSGSTATGKGGPSACNGLFPSCLEAA